jgi:2-dehydro-3-deoxygalactonokinase
MGDGHYIAGDWGTTRLRLSLCQGDAVVDSAAGDGIAALAEPAEAHFLRLTENWRRRFANLPVFFCGMVGSRLGWREAPYAPCPGSADAIARHAIRFQSHGFTVAIAPGLTCTNPLGAPDVMRGEETQIQGAVALNPHLAKGRQLLALPGTHSKWVLLDNGVVKQFLTVPAGEVFALLADHSTLTRGADRGRMPLENFRAGVARQAETALLPALFEVRTRQLIEGLSPDQALGFLSGLMIGADVAAALQSFGRDLPVAAIGEPALVRLYLTALADYGVHGESIDGSACVLAGLRAIFGVPN